MILTFNEVVKIVLRPSPSTMTFETAHKHTHTYKHNIP